MTKTTLGTIAILSLALSGITSSANAEPSAELRGVWLEAEAGELSGGYTVRSDERASDGSYIRVDSPGNAEADASYSVEVSQGGTFDLWVLGTPGNVNWASAYQWRIDSAPYSAAQPTTQLDIVYRSLDSRNVPLRWQKIAAADLESGTHQLDFKVSTARTLDGTLTIQYLDAIALAPQEWSWTPEGFTKPFDPGDRWLEAELAMPATGGFEARNLSNASGGRVLSLDSPTLPSSGAAATLPFAVDSAAEYDIWVLSTPGNENWASPFTWAVDSQLPQTFAPTSSSEIIYRTADARQVPLRWYRLTTSLLDAGSHALTLNVSSVRALDPDNPLAITYVDTVAVVPTSWNASLTSLLRPFDPSRLGLDFIHAVPSRTDAARTDQLAVDVRAQLTKPFSGSVLLRVELRREGRVVVGATSPMSLSGFSTGEYVDGRVDLTIPFDAPLGQLEVTATVVNAGFTQGATGSGGTITVGGTPPPTTRVKVVTASADLPDQAVVGSSLTVNTSFALDQAVTFDTRPYIALFSAGELRAVAEGTAQLPTSTWNPGEPHTQDVSFSLPEEMNAGSYTAYVGLHGAAMPTAPVGELHITGDSDTGWKPLSNGQFVDADGISHLWYVSQTGTMVWDGSPYVPIGGMWVSRYIREYDARYPAQNEANWAYDRGVLEAMSAAGVKDMYVNAVVSGGGASIPSWAWQFLIDALEDLGFNYGLQFNGYTGPSIEGDLLRVSADQNQFTVADFTGQGTVSKELDLTTQYPTARSISSARYAVVDSTSGIVVEVGAASIVETGTKKWTASVDLNLPTGSYAVRFTPRVVAPSGGSGGMQNFWEDPAAGRAALVELIGDLRLGSGFRLFIDPTGNEANIVNYNESLRVRSDAFDSAYAQWLSDRYGTLDLLNSSWATSPAVADFETAARLTPVNTNPRLGNRAGEITLTDPTDSTLHVADGIRGTLWDDYLTFRADAYRTFNNETADAIKAEVNAPVVYKYTGALKAFFVQTESNGGFDGLGGEIYGDEQHILREKVGYSYSAAQASSKTLWLLTTETQLDEDTTRKAASGEVGYPSEDAMHAHFDTLLAGGEKGIFDFLFDGYHDSRLQNYYAYSAKPEQYEWLLNYRQAIHEPEVIEELAASRPDDLYFMYPGAQTWWIQPNERSAVLPSPDYDSSGVLRTGDGKYVVSTFDPTVASGGVLVVNLERGPATTVWGGDLETHFDALVDSGTRIVVTGLREDLGALPSIDDFYSEELLTLESGATAQALRPSPQSEVLRTDGGDVWALREGNLWIIATDSWHDNEEIWFLDELAFDEPPTPTPDTQRPLVNLSSPSDGLPLRELTIRLAASDDRGLERIVGNIYRDGILVKSTQTIVAGAAKSALHEADVLLPAGDYVLRYNAKDISGNNSATRTADFVIDLTPPAVTVKEGELFTSGAEDVYDVVSFKLFDAHKIDKVSVNGLEKDLANNHWSDLNFVRSGQLGAVKGANTLTVWDMAGNEQTLNFNLR